MAQRSRALNLLADADKLIQTVLLNCGLPVNRESELRRIRYLIAEVEDKIKNPNNYTD